MSIIGKDNYRKIEYYLYNYDTVKKEVHEKRQDIILQGSQELGQWGGGQSYHNDPTASRAIKLCKKDIVKQEKWLDVVDQVHEHYNGTDKGKLIQMNYIDETPIKDICESLKISRRTFFEWKNEIVTYAALVATQKKLIKIA